MFYVWLIVVIALAIIEAATVNLTTIWFVISGIVSLFLSFSVDNIFIQFFVFVVGGIILLFSTRPFLKKWMSVPKESTNFDRIIGMEGIVTEEIQKNQPGEVKVDGKYWTAMSHQSLKIGEVVQIKEINGVKLIVEK
ncbi:MAG: NfeD family protein [Firmicutes bacterium]|nr:NfeD family protein [Bacillota bacterium]